jgi:phage gp46-like protein
VTSGQIAIFALFLGVMNGVLLLIAFYLSSIRNLLTKEIALLEDATKESGRRPNYPPWTEQDAAANLTSRLADLQREKFSPRIVR